MSLALYRKYRPGSFSEVLGQEHVTAPLQQALRNGRIHHAYLFSGPRGCGKTSSARILARSLNCEQGPTPDPCGVCDSCIALAPNGPGSLDVEEIDAASHGGVDDARDLRERAFYAPVSSRYKVYIIDEAHMVSREGFNALLKLVEEPPEFLRFVFATTEPEKVLPTIRSRTHHYPFRLMPRADLTALLTSVVASEGIEVDPTVLPLVVRAAAGSARDGLSILDQVLASAGPEGVTREAAAALLGVTPDTLLDDVVDAFAARDGASVFATVDRVMEGGHDPRRFAGDVLERLRDLVVLDAVPDAGQSGLLDCPPDQLDRMQRQVVALGTAGLSRAADLFHDGLTEMRGTTAPRLLLELVCARVLLPAASLDDAALLSRLERLERRLDITDDTTSASPVGRAAAGAGAAGPPLSGRDAARAAAVAVSASPASSARSGRAGEGAGRPAPSAGPAAPVAPLTAVPPAPAGQAERPVAAAAASTPVENSPAPTAWPEAARPGGTPSLTAPAGPAAPPVAEAAPAPAPAAEVVSPAGRPTQSGVASSPSTPPESAESAESADSSGGTRVPPAEVPPSDLPSSDLPPTQPPSADVPSAPAAQAEPASAEVSAPGGAGGLDVTAVRQSWDAVLESLSRVKRVAWTQAVDAQVQSLVGRRLTLAFTHVGTMRAFEGGSSPDFVKDALREVLGLDVDLVCVEGGAEAAAAQATQARAAGGAPAAPVAVPAYEGLAPGDEIEPEDPDAPTPPTSRVSVEEAALDLVTHELGGRVIGTMGDA